ncbi:MAG: hypothetical protein ACLU00_10535 [Mediterraneibacter faecis]
MNDDLQWNREEVAGVIVIERIAIGRKRTERKGKTGIDMVGSFSLF